MNNIVIGAMVFWRLTIYVAFNLAVLITVLLVTGIFLHGLQPARRGFESLNAHLPF